MKSFKQYTKEKKKKPSILSWDSSHAEIRSEPVKKKPDVLSWDSSFAEIRGKKSIKEAIADPPYYNPDDEKFNDPYKYPRNSKNNGYGAGYDADFHDHPDVKPEGLSDIHKGSILHYTSTGSKDPDAGYASSANINGYLRNKLGNKSVGVYMHDPKRTHRAVQNLSSAFTPENTNIKPIKTWGAVPREIGEKLMNSGRGSDHHLAGFTSTSSSKRVASNFSDLYANNERKQDKYNGIRHPEANDDQDVQVHHIVRYHIKPDAGLSAVHHTKYDENEVILHHGARVTYLGTEHHDELEDSQLDRQYNDGKAILKKYHIHHVMVHPDHKKLEEYGEYDHPTHINPSHHPEI
jgi:hypothetical protein